MSSKEKKGFKLPHQLVILFCIAAIAMVATYIVPAGVYEQIEINGRKAIDASSFHYVDQVPVSPLDGPSGPHRRLCEECRYYRHDYLYRRRDPGYQRHQVH